MFYQIKKIVIKYLGSKSKFKSNVGAYICTKPKFKSNSVWNNFRLQLLGQIFTHWEKNEPKVLMFKLLADPCTIIQEILL